MAEAELIDACRVHAGVFPGDEALTLGAQRLQGIAEEGSGEDGVALGGELLRGGTHRTSAMRTTRFSRALISAATPMATARSPSVALT